MAWSLKSCHLEKRAEFPFPKCRQKSRMWTPTRKYSWGFCLLTNRKKGIVVLRKASKPLASVLGMVRYFKECLERAELCSLSNTKGSENHLGAISAPEPGEASGLLWILLSYEWLSPKRCAMTGKGHTAPFTALRIFQKMLFFLVTTLFYGQWLKVEVKKGNKRFHSEIRLEIYLRPPAGKIC